MNAHEIPLTDVPHVAIYELASMLEHSCYPNCCKSFTVDERLIVRAVQNIKKGDRITISYTDSLWGTINRREHLAFTKYFYCECKRCVDPTELSTYYSSLKCFDKSVYSFIINIVIVNIASVGYPENMIKYNCDFFITTRLYFNEDFQQ